ncbi:anti-sigma factor [Streptomyces melanogenes]|uniref:Regulator of SigK n=1 Tax=Streptomyces melanogenes TaxID=67326 RepID=A0ABZ1XC52_9ACTN|nr:anti-sigma factor [Streptomyces melanogenes]
MSPFSRIGRVHSLAVPYALNALEPRELRRFERHLAHCAACAAEVRELAAGTERLGRATARPAPDALRERVLREVRTTEQERPAPAPAPRRKPAPAARRPLVLATAATAALALIGAVLLGVQLHRTQERLDAERARARSIGEVLAAPDARARTERDGRGRGISAVTAPGLHRAVVTVSGLGAPPEGRVRQLWVMVDQGAAPRSAGLLQGEQPVVVTGLAFGSRAFAVTDEPEGGSPRPTTAPLVQLDLASDAFGE